MRENVVLKKSKSALKDVIAPYLFILPFIISYIIFFLFPAVYSFILSFYSYKGYGSARFIGFQNYINLFQYGTMWTTLINTFLYFILSFIPVMLISFSLALIVRSDGVKKYQSFYKPLIFLPQMCAIVAASLVFRIIFGGRVGVVNQLLGAEIPFLNDTSLFKFPVICLMIWRATGWFFVIYLAGLTTISDEIYEAALMDGASAFQRVVYVTIPLMKPIFMFAFMTNLIGSLKLFTEPNLMVTGDLPMKAAPYVNVVYNNIVGANFGMASAAGWFLFIVIALLTLFQFSLFRRGEDS